MPKRKHKDDYDHVLRKIRRLERKLLRKGRKRRYDDDADESPQPSPQASEHSSQVQEIEDTVMLSYEEVVSAEIPAYNDRADNINEQPGQSALPVITVPSVVQVPSSSITTCNPVPEAVNSTATSSTVTTAPPAASAAPPAITAESATPAKVDLDSDLLEILGIDPTAEKKYGKDIQKDLSVRLEHYTTTGLSKELRKELKEKYLTPANCKLIDPPALNAEIKAAVSDIIVKRDKAIEGKQGQLASAITCLGEAITTLLSSKEKDTALLKLLMDAARLICDCQHADTVTRRNFLLNSVKKEMKEQIQNTKIDKFLFGENFAETLKSAKAITKSGADLKTPAPKTTPVNKKTGANTSSSNSKNLNWRDPGPTRRPSGPPRTKEPATTSTRSRPASSSRTSQNQQQRSTNNRR